MYFRNSTFYLSIVLFFQYLSAIESSKISSFKMTYLLSLVSAYRRVCIYKSLYDFGDLTNIKFGTNGPIGPHTPMKTLGNFHFTKGR